MRQLAWALPLLLGSLAARGWAQPAATGGSPAEGYAALVGGAAPGSGVVLILRSDVVFRAMLEDARGSAAPAGPASRARLDPRQLRAALGVLVGEALIANEAARTGVPSPRNPEVGRALDELGAWAGGLDRLRDLAALAGLDDPALRAMARRRAQVRSFLEANLEGTAVVTDARLRQVWESGEHPFTNAETLADVQDDLRGWLARRSLERALLRWVRVLRGRSTVRVLADW